MRPPRQHPPKFSLEHLLLLGALAVFAAGSVWVAHSARGGAAAGSGSWLGALPHLALPLFYALLRR